MRLLSLSLVALVFGMISCQKSESSKQPADEITTDEVVARCASTEVLEEKLAADPDLRKKMQGIETHTANVLQNRENFRLLADGTIEIPVVVHVLYRSAAENISDAQIASQIDVLNEDFSNTNLDSSKVPAHFAHLNTNVGIRFVLDQTIRKYSSNRSWQLNDAMKFSSSGGSDAIDPQNKLNMWVVNKMTYRGGSILGYAQFPGGAWASDGVVIGYNYFGRTGNVSAPYNLGRTATHEVGHWINLYHIWGDATCGSDLVDDTPQHNTSNGGCPTATHKSTCAGTPLEMWMNYMDYTYDACMYMFTHKQRDRMRSVFTPGGFRSALAQ